MKSAIALSCLLAAPGIVLAVAAEVSEPATYHLAEDTDALWSYAEPGEGRMPSIDIIDDIYPDESGVQFLVDGEPDDRNPGARPDGYDATGPQDDSTFHIYPKLDLVVGMKLEARWRDGAGTAHRTTWTVGESRFVHALVGEDLASWTHVEPSGSVEPTITIDDSIYPNERGVQFIIDGQVYDSSKARPDGFDATGPQDGSEFHAYPKLKLSNGMQLEARWIDRSRVGRSSVYYVGSGVVDPETALPNVETPTTEAPTPDTTTAPTTTIVVTLPPSTTQPPVTTTTTSPPPETTVAPPTDGDVGAAVAWADVEAGSARQPTIVIDGELYPNSTGVQFLVNGSVDDRCGCRPDGYDATGPDEDSNYHIYPDIALTGGDVIEARWVARDGRSLTSTVTVQAVETDDTVEPVPAPSTTSDDGLNPVWTSSNGEGIFRVSPYSVPAGFPSAGTTGVPAGTSLTPSGGLRIVEHGTVIDGWDIDGSVSIEADNVTIRNSRITAGGSFVVKVGKAPDGRTYSNFVIEDSRLRGIGACEAAIVFSNYTARRVHVSGCADGLKAFSNTTIIDSYIVDRYKVSDPDNSGGGTHNDGIQSSGGRNIVIRGNTILGAYQSSTSAIKVTAEQNDLSDVVIEGNYLSGGAFTVYTTQKEGYRASNITVRNNTFEVASSLFGETKNTAADATYSGNVLYDPR